MASEPSSTESSTEHYLFYISLCDVDNPVISRMMSVPKSITFHKFHTAIRIAFGWRSTGDYSFRVMEFWRRTPTPFTPSPALPGVLVRLDERATLPQTHPFVIPKSCVNETLEGILNDPRYAGRALEYLHKNWEHMIMEVGTQGGNGVIKCISGTGHGVVDHCVGILEWQALKAVFRKLITVANPESSNQGLSYHELELIKRYRLLFNGDLDPYQWSIEDVNTRLARIR